MLASGVEFILNGANHLTQAVSSYPFAIFGGDWAAAMDDKSYPSKGNTTVGNDVWIGYRATILPGVTIGDGAIIGAYAVVMRDVAPYTIVGGNPATVIRARFDPVTTAQLLAVAWWHWPIDRITRYAALLTGDPVAFLAVVQQEQSVPEQVGSITNWATSPLE